jgi:hypothetical protein
VVGIDHIKDLVDLSVSNTARNHDQLMSSDRLQYVVGDGRKGYPAGAPYDCIHVGAAAPTLPQPVSLSSCLSFYITSTQSVDKATYQHSDLSPIGERVLIEPLFKYKRSVLICIFVRNASQYDICSAFGHTQVLFSCSC